MAVSTPCGYGNKIIDGDKILYTSANAVMADLQCVYKMFETSVTMLSKLLNLPIEQLVQDLYNMSGCNTIEEAIYAVLEKSGKDTTRILTITELQFEKVFNLIK